MAADAQGSAADEGPPLTELEALQLKSNNITDESLDSTRRMIALCEDSQASGAKTLNALDHQGEQLNRVEEDMDKINAEMKQAEKHLKGMEKWCGLCIFPWNRTRKVRDDDTWKKPNDDKSGASAGVGRQPGPSSSGSRPDGPMIQRINNDAREDEMEENLQGVSGMLSNLKSMAEDMGNSVEEQNKQIDRMQNKSAAAHVRIKGANKRTEALMK
jgi:synaptosomal-associated protein 25